MKVPNLIARPSMPFSEAVSWLSGSVAAIYGYRREAGKK